KEAVGDHTEFGNGTEALEVLRAAKTRWMNAATCPEVLEPGSHVEKDAGGEEVPSQAVEAFVIARDMEKWAKRLRALKTEATGYAKGPAGFLLDPEGIKLQFRNVEHAVLDNKPARVLPDVLWRYEEGVPMLQRTRLDRRARLEAAYGGEVAEDGWLT